MRGAHSPWRFLAIALGAACIVLIGLCTLPHDRYIRFQSLTDVQVVKAGWIYERIHYDPSPIDVMFVGTSHTVYGIDSALVEQACRSSGGTACATVNFGLLHLGRNVHWLLTREAIEAHKPRLLVIEVQETESRALHPAFAALAMAPLVINTSFFPDLAHLPLRQLLLFARTRAPGMFGMHRRFSPTRYRGAYWDDTFEESGSLEHPVANPQPRTHAASLDELERDRIELRKDTQSRLWLPAALKPLQYRANLIYLQKMLELAREQKVTVRFLYMPVFRGPDAPSFADFYDAYAPTWKMPREINGRPDLWTDIGHLNYAGARLFSAWLGKKIATDMSLRPIASVRDE
jgi:hypothetical protein